jgi:hypothetical protein
VTLAKATEAQEVSRACDLLTQARVALLVADRSTDLRTALVAVREALSITARLSGELRGIAAVEEPTREAQACEDGA